MLAAASPQDQACAATAAAASSTAISGRTAIAARAACISEAIGGTGEWRSYKHARPTTAATTGDVDVGKTIRSTSSSHGIADQRAQVTPTAAGAATAAIYTDASGSITAFAVDCRQAVDRYAPLRDILRPSALPIAFAAGRSTIRTSGAALRAAGGAWHGRANHLGCGRRGDSDE
jgi:hypothetical protein